MSLSNRRARTTARSNNDNNIIKHKNLEQKDGGLKMVIYMKDYLLSGSSETFVIDNLIQFKLKYTTLNTDYNDAVIASLYIMFTRLNKCQNNAKLISNTLGIDNVFCTCKENWQLISVLIKNTEEEYCYDIDITRMPEENRLLPPSEATLTFASLLDDDELTDFELRVEDGAIRVHKAVLAAVSPVFRRMLCGTWKEAGGTVEVQGATIATLQAFKNYIYSGVLRQTGLEHLVYLASFYMMPGLEQQCINGLVSSLTAENINEMLEFSVSNKLTRLSLAIMYNLQNGKVQVKDIENHLCETKVSKQDGQ